MHWAAANEAWRASLTSARLGLASGTPRPAARHPYAHVPSTSPHAPPKHPGRASSQLRPGHSQCLRRARRPAHRSWDGMGDDLPGRPSLAISRPARAVQCSAPDSTACASTVYKYLGCGGWQRAADSQSTAAAGGRRPAEYGPCGLPSQPGLAPCALIYPLGTFINCCRRLRNCIVTCAFPAASSPSCSTSPPALRPLRPAALRLHFVRSVLASIPSVLSPVDFVGKVPF